ncbi:PREDICTED: polygalacturonase 1 beta-like protein 3 [Camelina sativa]|uniref:Polygalacturonase 1 beta-like protein 3 n=1 Tax=Camelina sativa TaxID=90675 RepID=A0ABM0U5U7_CAMSA|nr:PREDICTED: polygalacturonase 1 beta-like protein 3 [Camelina sativa]
MSFLIDAYKDGFSAEQNPFTPKASLVRYWNKEIRSESPRSEFLISKASPLNVVDSTTFSKPATTNSLPTRFPDFCSAANIFCFPDLGTSLEKHDEDVKFSTYDQKNFTNYGSGRPEGDESFKYYAKDGNVVTDSFRRYSHNSAAHDDKFTVYGENSNVIDQGFNVVDIVMFSQMRKPLNYENLKSRDLPMEQAFYFVSQNDVVSYVAST